MVLCLQVDFSLLDFLCVAGYRRIIFFLWEEHISSLSWRPILALSHLMSKTLGATIYVYLKLAKSVRLTKVTIDQ